MPLLVLLPVSVLVAVNLSRRSCLSLYPCACVCVCARVVSFSTCVFGVGWCYHAFLYAVGGNKTRFVCLVRLVLPFAGWLAVCVVGVVAKAKFITSRRVLSRRCLVLSWLAGLSVPIGKCPSRA